MTTQVKPKEIWIGLVEVRPLEGCEILDDGNGAFINVVMWAASTDEYTRKSESAAAEMKLFVVDVEKPEPVDARRKGESDFEEEIKSMISRSYDYPDEIVFGTFHLYQKEDS